MKPTYKKCNMQTKMKKIPSYLAVIFLIILGFIFIIEINVILVRMFSSYNHNPILYYCFSIAITIVLIYKLKYPFGYLRSCIHTPSRGGE